MSQAAAGGDTKRRKLDESDISTNKTGSKQQLSIRSYLDQTVTPALLKGMTALVKIRPEEQDPIAWLGNWLIEYSKNPTIAAAPSPAEKNEKKVTSAKKPTEEKAAGKEATPSEAAAASPEATSTTDAKQSTDEKQEDAMEEAQ